MMNLRFVWGCMTEELHHCPAGGAFTPAEGDISPPDRRQCKLFMLCIPAQHKG